MKQELPNLVDERRFRRREQPEVERDEFGRVSQTMSSDELQLADDSLYRGNGPRNEFLSTLSRSKVSTCEPRLSVKVERTSSIFNKRQVAKSRSKDAAPASENMAQIERAMSPCICMLRMLCLLLPDNNGNI